MTCPDCDLLARDLAQAIRERDAALWLASKHLVDLSRELHRADTAERELSEAREEIDRQALGREIAQQALDTIQQRDEARAALERVTRQRDAEVEASGVAQAMARASIDALGSRAKSAEASCREQAAAIVVLRELLGAWRDLPSEPGPAEGEVTTDDDSTDIEAWRSKHVSLIAATDAVLGAPLPALAFRLSAERKAERDVVRAAQHFVKVARLAETQSVYVKESGRHGSSPWAELVEAVTAPEARQK